MVKLRPIEVSDFEGVRVWIENPVLTEFFRRFPPAGVWLQRDIFLSAFSGHYMICQDGTPVGMCNLANVDQHSKKAEFGIMIAPQPGPRGQVATEALKQLFDYAFSYSGMNKLYCQVLPGRPEIQKLCERWGIKHDGVLRQNIFFQGRFHDEHLFSMTADDYFKTENR